MEMENWVWKEREIRKLGRIEAEQRMRRRLREKMKYKIGSGRYTMWVFLLLISFPISFSSLSNFDILQANYFLEFLLTIFRFHCICKGIGLCRLLRS
ncbi:hypothetical protein P8452_32226 [Trifolium repens]|nr:hypothetical protein P8452_32226 [Trifolium repens]